MNWDVSEWKPEDHRSHFWLIIPETAVYTLALCYMTGDTLTAELEVSFEVDGPSAIHRGRRFYFAPLLDGWG